MNTGPILANDVTRAGPPPSRRTGLLGTLVDGRYMIRSVLGRGGMGTVYEAQHVGVGRVVAMKVLHPIHAKDAASVKRFQQEARATGTIGHPNVCAVYDFGALPDASPYIVMERLRGHTLAARIAREGALRLDETIDIVSQLLSGLDAAHARGVVHRDIKPDNVFLVEGGGVKLLDFGVSKFLVKDEWSDTSSITGTGIVMGTPCYFAPEQARGDRDLDARVDVYACGALLYEALTGQRPYESASYTDLLVKIALGAAPPVRGVRASVPVEVERVVSKAMAKSRDDRYAGARDLARALTSSSRRAAGS